VEVKENSCLQDHRKEIGSPDSFLITFTSGGQFGAECIRNIERIYQLQSENVRYTMLTFYKLNAQLQLLYSTLPNPSVRPHIYYGYSLGISTNENIRDACNAVPQSQLETLTETAPRGTCVA